MEKTELRQLRALDLNQLALVLTVLDKEAHNVHYYERLRKKGEDEQSNGYLESLGTIMESFVFSLSESSVVPFIEANPHLAYLFEFDEDGNEEA